MLSVSRLAACSGFSGLYNSPFIMHDEHTSRVPVALGLRPNELRTVSKAAVARFFTVAPVSVTKSAGSGCAASASSTEDAYICCTFRFFLKTTYLVGKNVLISASGGGPVLVRREPTTGKRGEAAANRELDEEEACRVSTMRTTLEREKQRGWASHSA